MKGVLIKRCLDSDDVHTSRIALSLLFWLTKNAGFDGETRVGQDVIVAYLLREAGDMRFAEALKEELPETRSSVRLSLTSEFGILDEADYPGVERERREFRRLFPRTSELLSIAQERKP